MNRKAVFIAPFFCRSIHARAAETLAEKT